MTSCIDNPPKVSAYILNCRSMKIEMLPPDINKSEGRFTVENGAIRYGLCAAKGIGKPVMDAVVEERGKNGEYRSMKDFIERLSGKEVNKRTLESLIKAGAFDNLGGTRKQFMMVYTQLVDEVNRDRKNSMAGQMSLFDLISPEEKAVYEVHMPDVGEYSKEEKLAFEKEVLGVYISGHPLEEYEERWRRNITAVTTDFLPDEDTQEPKVRDGAKEVIGGMITDKTVKYTKNNKTMAFLTIEDLLGTVEVIVFPRDYEKNVSLMNEDAKVFVRGRVSEEEDKPSKLICERIYSFDEIPQELWVQFSTREEYENKVSHLYDMLKESDGSDRVVLYIKGDKSLKRLPPSRNVKVDEKLISQLSGEYGKDNVRVVEKSIEKRT